MPVTFQKRFFSSAALAANEFRARAFDNAWSFDRLTVNGQFEVPGFGQLKVPGLHGGSGSARGGSGSALGLSHSV